MPSTIQPIKNVTVTAGGNVTLSCNVSGTPSPIVSWIKADGQRTNRRELMLININRSEAGEYRCEASNQCGNASETASINVLCKLLHCSIAFYNCLIRVHKIP